VADDGVDRLDAPAYGGDGVGPVRAAPGPQAAYGSALGLQWSGDAVELTDAVVEPGLMQPEFGGSRGLGL
jgi:hypothetical protein